MKPAIASKTVIVNTILTLLGVMALLMETPSIPQEWLPWIAVGIGVLNIVLRIWFTSEPIQGVFKTKKA